MQKYKKISDTSIRVLETLKLLFDHGVSIQDIIHHFQKIDPNKRIYTNEVILKYINTLKVFGFKFGKEKDKYILLNTPEQFYFNEKDLKAICLIETAVATFQENDITAEINNFLNSLEKRFSDNTKLLARNINKSEFSSLEFNFKNYSLQIKKYEKYISDGQRLKIIYKNQNKKEISIMVEPNEIKYKDNEVYFSVYNPVSAQILDLNFNSIIKVEQLPLKSNQMNMFSSVTFELKDRLAKAYKLHDGEKLLLVKADGDIVVLNQKEDRMLLLKRLMRYGQNCEVLSPKNLGEEMTQLIKSTLANY